ncbi:hypothetical protein CQW23_09495 [Capsicum baccatum]|uniref:LRAT domain-containing protein n=1 Tax=Capsicum baccatum TaxID=33114 RepID=A0A2G2WWX8_CAPBA|nr:hypothetical protein CQW23_09495 [Capsicum baccatum]
MPCTILCTSCLYNHPRKVGIISTCLECFLSGGKLYHYKHGVSKGIFYAQVRGTCTLSSTDSSEDVIHRAETLFAKNSFGNYKLSKNNYEDFAIYCKTGYNLHFGTGGHGDSVRYLLDVGVHEDLNKIPVEELVDASV